jgi:glucoamylase
MLSLQRLLVLATSLTSILASPVHNEPRATGSLSSWLAFENGVALQGILNNIGSSGSKAAGAKAGIIVASPSKSDPDCGFNIEYTEHH